MRTLTLVSAAILTAAIAACTGAEANDLGLSNSRTGSSASPLESGERVELTTRTSVLNENEASQGQPGSKDPSLLEDSLRHKSVFTSAPYTVEANSRESVAEHRSVLPNDRSIEQSQPPDDFILLLTEPDASGFDPLEIERDTIQSALVEAMRANELEQVIPPSVPVSDFQDLEIWTDLALYPQYLSTITTSCAYSWDRYGTVTLEFCN